MLSEKEKSLMKLISPNEKLKFLESKIFDSTDVFTNWAIEGESKESQLFKVIKLLRQYTKNFPNYTEEVELLLNLFSSGAAPATRTARSPGLFVGYKNETLHSYEYGTWKCHPFLIINSSKKRNFSKEKTDLLHRVFMSGAGWKTIDLFLDIPRPLMQTNL
jgi:hypothetical protein